MNYNDRQRQSSNIAITDLSDRDPIAIGEIVAKESKRNLTASQLRKIMSAATSVKNKIERESSDKDELSSEIVDEINYMRLRVIYQMGRFENVNYHLGKKGGLIDLPEIIRNIGKSKKKFMAFYRLIESIIAYNKFYSA